MTVLGESTSNVIGIWDVHDTNIMPGEQREATHRSKIAIGYVKILNKPKEEKPSEAFLEEQFYMLMFFTLC